MTKVAKSAAALVAGITLPVLVMAQAVTGDDGGDGEPSPGQSEYAERAERMLATAIEADDELGTARAQYLLAQHMKALRLWPQALTHARLAREAAELAGDENTRVAADIAYGAALGQLSRAAEAIEILLPSLDRSRALESVEQQLWALLALDTAYFHARQLEQAEDYANQGLELARANAHHVHTARFLSNLGLIAYTRGDIPTAEEFIQEALTIDDLPPDIQRTLTMASISLATATQTDAAERAREAIATARRDGSTFHEGFATAQLGEILCHNGELQEAAQAFETADAMLREGEALTDLQSMYEVWAQCLEGHGEFESALAHQREAKALLEQAHARRQDEIRQAHEIAFRTEQRLTELARLTAEEQTLQTRIARQREFTGWLAAGALLLLGVITGFWFRNRHLREQRNAQQALQQARVDLLARTSHEIRNPTQGIVGILEGRPASDRPLEKKHLDTVLSAARMVGHLANEYLDLALLEQGKFKIESCSLCHIPALVDRLETLSSAFIKAPGQFLVTRIDDRAPEWIHADGERLVQVLLNLISNAAHYAGDGEITLTISADPEAKTINFSVADRGPGFDPSDAANFDPYARGTRRGGNPRGSGLGLAISARIVNAMGGTIVVRNRRAGGADLSLTFPLHPARQADSPDPAPEADARPKVRPAPPSPASGPKRVLVIDDDPFARLGLRTLVESTGGRVEELDSGENLETHLQRFDPEAVLIDYRLGGATGIDIARRIRQHDSERAVPRLVAIISGSEGMENEKDADNAIDKWLLKPVGRDGIAELLAGSP